MRKWFFRLFAAGAMFFLSPAVIGVVHIGMLWSTAALLLAAAWCRWGKRWPRWLNTVLTVCYSTGIAAVMLLFIWMGTYAWGHTPSAENAPAPATVIVPGCQVYDGLPGVILQNRIDAAYRYLLGHPDAVCIASGGMDDRETVTEADCIRSTLIAMGISPDRIYAEDSSGSTAENLRFSAKIIEAEGLSTDCVIATDGFHQFRAAAFARENGLTPYSESCRTPWYFAPGYWCREMAGIAAMWIRGY